MLATPLPACPMTRPTLSERLSPRARRVLQATLYEGIAIACVTPADVAMCT